MYCENLNCTNDQCKDFPEPEMVQRDDGEVEVVCGYGSGQDQGDVCPECIEQDRDIRFTI